MHSWEWGLSGPLYNTHLRGQCQKKYAGIKSPAQQHAMHLVKTRIEIVGALFLPSRVQSDVEINIITYSLYTRACSYFYIYVHKLPESIFIGLHGFVGKCDR